jgi:hypothetical protein
MRGWELETLEPLLGAMRLTEGSAAGGGVGEGVGLGFGVEVAVGVGEGLLVGNGPQVPPLGLVKRMRGSAKREPEEGSLILYKLWY